VSKASPLFPTNWCMVLNQTFAPYSNSSLLDISDIIWTVPIIALVSRNLVLCRALHWEDVENLMGWSSTLPILKNSTPLLIKNWMKAAVLPPPSISNMMVASLSDRIIIHPLLQTSNHFRRVHQLHSPYSLKLPMILFTHGVLLSLCLYIAVVPSCLLPTKTLPPPSLYILLSRWYNTQHLPRLPWKYSYYWGFISTHAWIYSLVG